MIFDWTNTDIKINTFGKYSWRKGETCSWTWTGNVTDNHIWIPYKGEGVVSTHEGKKPIKKGLALWYKPGFTYNVRQNPQKPIGMYAIHFNIISKLNTALPVPPDFIGNINYEYIEYLFNKMIAVGAPIKRMGGYIISDNDYRHEKCLILAKLLLIKIDELIEFVPVENQHNSEVDKVMVEMIRKIQEDPTYRPKINEIAEQLGLTASNFCHAFKRRYLRSPNQCMIEWRMTHAARLLSETNLSVKEIAKVLGYNSLHLFGRQFKRRTDHTPLQFRKLEDKFHF